MAAPEVEAQEVVFRTTGPPTDSEPHPLPPSSRKFPFESTAASSTQDWAVAEEHLLKGNEEDCGPELAAPGDQPSHPAGTASAKTVCDAQPHVMPSGSLPADAQATSKLPVKIKEVDGLRHLHPGSSESDTTKVTKSRQENRQMKAAEIASKRNIKKRAERAEPQITDHCQEARIGNHSNNSIACPPKPSTSSCYHNFDCSYKPFKQKPEEELKDKNQLLESVNKQLHQKLMETQGELKDLTQKVELLEKFQNNCLAILESKGLNPGSETLASEKKPTIDHTDSVLLLETLQDELKVFNETAKKQMEELKALKVKLKLKEEERGQFLKQQNSCKEQASDFTKVLEEMEKLLEM